MESFTESLQGFRHNHLLWKNWAEEYLLHSVPQTMANRKSRNERKKSVSKRGERLSIQGEIFLFPSESLAEEDWGCRDSRNTNYFEMSEVNKMKPWNASRSWKWDLKRLKILTFLQENSFHFYFKMNISAGIHEFLLAGTRYALMKWSLLTFLFINIISFEWVYTK